jgi:tetratricopeptide (TPR) repeat protein
MKFFARGIIFLLLLCSGLFYFANPRSTRAQSSQGMTHEVSGLTVHVQEAGGGPLLEQAVVTLTSSSVSWIQTEVTHQEGLAEFARVPEGDYTISVSAAGYQTARDDVNVFGHGRTETFISLNAAGSSTGAKTYPGVPLLAGKARKELDAALKALQANQVTEAKAHITNALKSAPGHPDVQYVAGLCALVQKNSAAAQKYYETAIGLYPPHFGAQLGLGTLLLQQNDASGAVLHLEKALSIEPNNWRAHWLIAEAYLSATHDFAKAKPHAMRAIELGGLKAADAQVTLARVEMLAGEQDAARTRLQKFVADYPTHTSVQRAEALLRSIGDKPQPGVADSKTAGPASTSESLAAAPEMNYVPDIPPTAILSLPLSVDDDVPPVDPAATCQLPQVLEGVGHRLTEFVDGLERFSAKEQVVHDELDQTGARKKTYDHTFQYIATVNRPRKDAIILEESRDGTSSVTNFPLPMAVEGLPAIGLIFHPEYSQDFAFTCEGLGQWRGQAAWQVRFEQRQNRPARIHDWVVDGQTYSTILKGRAWISAVSFRLVRLETDLVKSIPQIHLDYQHMAIEYQPVSFRNGATQLWLPSTAEVYSRYRGHFFRQEHDFSDFLLYSVDVLRKDSPVGAHP